VKVSSNLQENIIQAPVVGNEGITTSTVITTPSTVSVDPGNGTTTQGAALDLITDPVSLI